MADRGHQWLAGNAVKLPGGRIAYVDLDVASRYRLP
jgi:hypothetical protein